MARRSHRRRDVLEARKQIVRSQRPTSTRPPDFRRAFSFLENHAGVSVLEPPFRTSRFHYLRFSGGGQPAMACGSVAEGRGQRP
jgi:hypothetical protein